MTLRKKIKNNKLTIGTWITINSPLIPDILSSAGFDWLCVDIEHTSIDLNDLMSLIISIENNNICPLVRVGENDSNLIKRVMDSGSYGVIVPNVCNSEDAISAVNAVKYPPTGTRGVGLYRAQGYGRSFKDYLKWLKFESVVIIQIEHIDAVENIDEILSVPNIDGFIIGPYDLSSSMGKPGKFEDKDVKEAIRKVLEVGRKYKLSSGFHSVSSKYEDLQKFINQKFNFLAFSLDSIFLGDKAFEEMKKIKKKIK